MPANFPQLRFDPPLPFPAQQLVMVRQQILSPPIRHATTAETFTSRWRIDNFDWVADYALDTALLLPTKT